jgi:hypothetical protein
MHGFENSNMHYQNTSIQMVATPTGAPKQFCVTNQHQWLHDNALVNLQMDICHSSPSLLFLSLPVLSSFASCVMSSTAQSAAKVKKRRLHEQPKPYAQTPGPPKGTPKAQSAPKTAVRTCTKKENLTLHNWITVFKWMDKNKSASQAAIVTYFATRHSGMLIFDQSMLSRKLAQ